MFELPRLANGPRPLKSIVASFQRIYDELGALDEHHQEQVHERIETMKQLDREIGELTDERATVGKIRTKLADFLPTPPSSP